MTTPIALGILYHTPRAKTSTFLSITFYMRCNNISHLNSHVTIPINVKNISATINAKLSEMFMNTMVVMSCLSHKKKYLLSL